MSKLRFGRYSVRISNADKVLFPGSGITKGDLIDYYRRVAPHMIRCVKDRPLSMHRFPDGIDEPGFFQKDISDYFPEWIKRVDIAKEKGTYTQVLANNTATLVYLANQACITPHVWLSSVDDLSRPDRIIFDLDPSDGDFQKVREAAGKLAACLKDAGLSVFAMLTGSSGIHLVAPIRRELEFDEVRSFARQISHDVVKAYKNLVTIEQRKDKRGNKVYIDILRNAYGQTVVAPYAVRAIEDAPVATPIGIDELDDRSLSPRKYTISNIFKRLSHEKNIWQDINRHARSLKGIADSYTHR